MTILVPEGLIPSDNGASVRFISYSIQIGHGSTSSDTPCFVLISVDSEAQIDAAVLSGENSVVNLSNLDYLYGRLLDNVADRNRIEDLPTPSVVKSSLFFVINTVLTMVSRPDLITPGSLVKSYKRKDSSGVKKAVEFWSPTILGNNYVSRVYGLEKSIPSSADSISNHRSPRLHWVHGYWKNQPAGPRTDPKYHHRWIEPYIRGV